MCVLLKKIGFFLWLYFVGSADVLPYVEMDLRKIAARVLEKAKEICTAKSVLIDSLVVDLFREINSLLILMLIAFRP